jgi:thiamine pyrophosphokinase
MTVIHRSDVPVCLVGGGEIGPDDMRKALALAPEVVAADGGAAASLRVGVMPAAVVGDFDSLDAETRARLPADRLHVISEQESTDFDKALRSVAAPLVIGLGFLGARLDHQLAALTTLAAHPDRACLLLGPEEVVLLLPPDLAVDTAPGDRVSIYPLLPVTGRSEGLRWPIDGLKLAPDGRIGTSNRATGPVRLTMDAPGALGMFPRACLAPLSRALTRPGAARWPARA